MPNFSIFPPQEIEPENIVTNVALDFDGVWATTYFSHHLSGVDFQNDPEKPAHGIKNFFVNVLRKDEEGLTQDEIITKRLNHPDEGRFAFDRNDFHILFPDQWQELIKWLHENNIAVFSGSQRVYMPSSRKNLKEFFKHCFPEVADILIKNLTLLFKKIPELKNDDPEPRDKNNLLIAIQEVTDCQTKQLLLIDDDPKGSYKEPTERLGVSFFHFRGTRPGTTAEACYRLADLEKNHLAILYRCLTPKQIFTTLYKFKKEPHAAALLKLQEEAFVHKLFSIPQSGQLVNTLKEIPTEILAFLKTNPTLLQADNEIHPNEHMILAHLHRHILNRLMPKLQQRPEFINEILAYCKAKGIIDASPQQAINLFINHFIAPYFQHIATLKTDCSALKDELSSLTEPECVVLKKIGDSLAASNYFNNNSTALTSHYLQQDSIINDVVSCWQSNIRMPAQISTELSTEFTFEFPNGLDVDPVAFIAQRIRLTNNPNKEILNVYGKKTSGKEGIITALCYNANEDAEATTSMPKYVSANGANATQGLNLAAIESMELAPLLTYEIKNGVLYVTFASTNLCLFPDVVNSSVSAPTDFNHETVPSPHIPQMQIRIVEPATLPDIEIFGPISDRIGDLLNEENLTGERRLWLALLHSQIENWQHDEKELKARHYFLVQKQNRLSEENIELEKLTEALKLMALLADRSFKQTPTRWEGWLNNLTDIFPYASLTTILSYALHTYHQSVTQPGAVDTLVYNGQAIDAFEINAHIGKTVVALAIATTALALTTTVYALGKILYPLVAKMWTNKQATLLQQNQSTPNSTKLITSAMQKGSTSMEKIAYLLTALNLPKKNPPAVLKLLSDSVSEFTRFDLAVRSEPDPEQNSSTIKPGSTAEKQATVLYALQTDLSQKTNLAEHLMQLQAKALWEKIAPYFVLAAGTALLGLLIAALKKLNEVEISQGLQESVTTFVAASLYDNLKGDAVLPPLLIGLTFISSIFTLKQIAKACYFNDNYIFSARKHASVSDNHDPHYDNSGLTQPLLLLN